MVDRPIRGRNPARVAADCSGLREATPPAVIAGPRRSGTAARRFALLFTCAVVLIWSGCAGVTPSEPRRVSTPNESAVLRWLKEWEEAWNLHDVRKLQVMSNLDTAEMLAVQRTFEDRADFQVEISNVRVREYDGGVVQATYTRLDRWTDARTGRVGSTGGAYEHSFRVQGGTVRPFGLKRR